MKKSTTNEKLTLLLVSVSLIFSAISLVFQFRLLPGPELKVIVLTDNRFVTCTQDGMNHSYNVIATVANTGTRAAFNTQLIVSSKDKINFAGANVLEFVRTVDLDTSRGGFNATSLGTPLPEVSNNKVSLLLFEIKPEESVTVSISFSNQCGSTQYFDLHAVERGYNASSTEAHASISWLRAD